jgi:hypothetical protein
VERGAAYACSNRGCLLGSKDTCAAYGRTYEAINRMRTSLASIHRLHCPYTCQLLCRHPLIYHNSRLDHEYHTNTLRCSNPRRRLLLPPTVPLTAVGCLRSRAAPATSVAMSVTTPRSALAARDCAITASSRVSEACELWAGVRC